MEWKNIRFRDAVRRGLGELGLLDYDGDGEPPKHIFDGVPDHKLLRCEGVGRKTLKELEKWLGRPSRERPHFKDIGRQHVILGFLWERGKIPFPPKIYIETGIEPDKAAFYGLSRSDLLSLENLGKKTLENIEKWMGRELPGVIGPNPEVVRRYIAYLEKFGYRVKKPPG